MDATLRSQLGPRHAARPLRERDPSDPARHAVELAQRGRVVLDVAAADLEAAEARLGPFHETTWYFRNALTEARLAWNRLRAEFGTRALEAALAQPPLVVLTLDGPAQPPATLIPIAGQTYRVECVAGTEPAPSQFRLTPLLPSEDAPYYACRLDDGSTQCDCAEWVYRVADIPDAPPCKHLAALAALGWL